MDEFGINIIVCLELAYSIASVGCNLARSLIRNNIPVSLLNLKLQDTPQPVPDDLKSHFTGNASGLKYPVNIYVLPLSLVGRLLETYPRLHDKKINIVNLWWEFTQLPAEYCHELARHDIILTHSHFLANLASISAPSAHVINTKLSWPVETVPANRNKFMLPQQSTIFTYAFDAKSECGTTDSRSGNGRKNPFELIRAFRESFPQTVTDVHLAIRAANVSDATTTALISAMHQCCGGDPRIQIISEKLNYQEVLTLYASSDVYISLHKAEGFGLGMFEAMALGKAVIATGWSGNMSFMNIANACLVRYKIASPGDDYRCYGMKLPQGAVWAEPSIDDAKNYMKLLHNDHQFRQHIGQRARAGYEQYQSCADRQLWIDELITYWKTFPFLPKSPDKYSYKAA